MQSSLALKVKLATGGSAGMLTPELLDTVCHCCAIKQEQKEKRKKTRNAFFISTL
jgi:hypothetical protein